MQALEGLDEVAAHGAADAAVHHLDDVLLGLLLDDLVVDSDLAKLVLDNGEAQAMVGALEDVVEQRRLARAEEAREDGHRDLFVGRGHVCTKPRDSGA